MATNNVYGMPYDSIYGDDDQAQNDEDYNPASVSNQQRRQGIANSYRQHLGRDIREDEYQQWMGNDSFDQGIAGSGEAQQRRQGQSGSGNTYQVSGGSGNTGVAGPTNNLLPFDRTAVRDGWMARGRGGNLQEARNYFGQYGIQVDGAGRAQLPTGEIIDTVFAGRTNDPNQQYATWTNAGGTQNGVPVTGGGGAGGGGGTGGGGGGAVSAGAQWDALYQQLLQRSQQGLAVGRNDPAVRSQADAYAANEERSKRDYLADQAERQGPNANLRSETRLANEKVGQRSGGFEAELVGREISAKRNEIAQALQQMGGMLSEQQRNALQRELALYDNELRRMQIAQQGSQFDRNFGLQAEDRASYWDWLRGGGSMN